MQAAHDRQTHSLPEEQVEQERLALAMNYPCWDSFREGLEVHRHRVQGHFDQVFVAPQAEAGDSEPAEDELAAVWVSELSAPEAEELLTEAGFNDTAGVYRRIAALRDGVSTRSLSATGRRRLDRLMPLLIAAAAGTDDPDETINRLLLVIDAIGRRTAYLSLLVEHPMALSQLVRLCGSSPWIARYLAKHPLLLDELLDPRTLYAPLRREELVADAESRLEGLSDEDLEQQMEVLRQFKQTNYLRVAAADISGAVPLMVVSDYLTEIAEVTLEAVLITAYRQITARYGKPWCIENGIGREPGFAVVAYGKLGGIELGYGSDLDLVFCMIAPAKSRRLTASGRSIIKCSLLAWHSASSIFSTRRHPAACSMKSIRAYGPAVNPVC
nr:hypothetical protein [Alkalilimnicola ehrlichii]